MMPEMREKPRLNPNVEDDLKWMLENSANILMDIPQFESTYDIPHYAHVVKFFYGPTCRHCAKIKPIIEARVAQEKGFLYLPINAMSRQGGKQLQALGYNSVPLVTVDDLYEIHSEMHFPERFDKVLKLVKQIPQRRNIFESIR